MAKRARATKRQTPDDIQQLIVGLLRIGGAPDVDELFSLIVAEAPKLVSAEECTVFWRDGPWRRKYVSEERVAADGPPAFYRRATYEAKSDRVGREMYLPGEGLTGWVAQHGMPLNIKNILDKGELKKIATDLKHSDKHGGHRHANHPDRQSAFLAVPVKIGDTVHGVIRIAKTKRANHSFSEHDQAFLLSFAENVAPIIHRAEERALRQLWDVLYRSGIKPEHEGLEDFLGTIAEKLPRQLGAEACSIFLTDMVGKKRVLKLTATTSTGPLAKEVRETLPPYDFGEGLTGAVAKYGVPIRLRNVEDEKEIDEFREKNGLDVLRHVGKLEEYVPDSSFLAAPIILGEDVLGVIRIAQDARWKSFSESEETLLIDFCGKLAVLLQNHALFEDVQRERDDALKRLRESKDKFQEHWADLRLQVTEIQGRMADWWPGDAVGPTKMIGPVTIENSKPDRDLVFVANPYSRRCLEILRYGIKPAIQSLGLRSWVAMDQAGAGDIRGKVLSGINQAHVAVVDITDENPNVMFELGVLYGQNHPVILIKDRASDVPTDLVGLEYVDYSDSGPLREQLERQLQMLLGHSYLITA